MVGDLYGIMCGHMYDVLTFLFIYQGLILYGSLYGILVSHRKECTLFASLGELCESSIPLLHPFESFVHFVVTPPNS